MAMANIDGSVVANRFASKAILSLIDHFLFAASFIAFIPMVAVCFHLERFPDTNNPPYAFCLVFPVAAISSIEIHTLV